MDYNPMGKEENPLSSPKEAALAALSSKLRRTEAIPDAAAKMTIEQLQELFPELTPLQARLLWIRLHQRRGRYGRQSSAASFYP